MEKKYKISDHTMNMDEQSTRAETSFSSPRNSKMVAEMAMEPEVKYKMYKRRWFGMLALVGLNLATGLVWLTFNSVSDISERWLNASLTEVNLTSMLYFLGSILTSSLSGFVFEKWGIKVAVSNIIIAYNGLELLT